MKKILVIDDDQHIREALAEILDLEGYDVDTANDGEQGLQALEHAPLPDLIILDLMMPRKDGFQFREEQRLNATWNRIPVIVLSADTKSRENADRLQVTCYLKKPLELDTLISTIAKTLSPT